MDAPRLADALLTAPRARLATLPTPLVRGPDLPGGAHLWVKRDDLTGLGAGGNKARKLEFLCGEALADGATAFVTVGAGQSNHTRQTAAAGAVLGVPVHLVLGDDPTDEPPQGNQLLSALFGARQLHAGGFDGDPIAAATDAERAAGREPAVFPLGGSTATGARGFAQAWLELAGQCATEGIRPAAIVHATSSGGTHAGLLAGRAAARAAGAGGELPDVVAIGVGKLLGDLRETALELARGCLDGLDLGDVALQGADGEVDWGFEGEGYAIPTPEADAAIRWAAERMALVLDRVYAGKAFAGLLGLAQAGRWSADEDVVFWHTGGLPSVFASGGVPV